MGGLFNAFRSKSVDEVAAKGDTGKLRKMVEKGANVNTPSSDPKLCGRSPIHAAASHGQVQMIETLVNLGANPDARDSYGRTALHYAILGLRTEVLRPLLASGADFTLRDSGGVLPIQLATSSGNNAAREMLLAHALEHSLEFEYWDQGHWYPYDEAAAKMLGFELGEGVGFAALALGPESNYIVDFEEHLQLNVLSLFMKSVGWRVLPNGKWNRPQRPHQGLHPGSQDPRLLRKYDSLLRSLASQGVPICPLYFELHDGLLGHNSSRQGGSSSRRPLSPATPPHISTGPQLGSDAGMPRSPSAPPPSGPLEVGEAQQSMALGGGECEPSWIPAALLDEASEPGTPLQRNRATEREGDHFGDASVQSERVGAPVVLAREGDGTPDGPVEVVTLQVLRSGCEEYNEVAARFLKGMEKQARSASGNPLNEEMRPVTISSIVRIRLPWERVEPFAKARAGLKARWGNDNVRRGWHGAPRPALDRILQQGFVLTPHGRNGRLFGDGIYLAAEDYARTSAEFASPDSSGVKHMLLCVAALGSMEQVPFESAQRRPSNVMRFDTGCDNLENPTRFVVWEEDMNDYILPTHLLSFRYC